VPTTSVYAQPRRKPLHATWNYRSPNWRGLRGVSCRREFGREGQVIVPKAHQYTRFASIVTAGGFLGVLGLTL
jgi:hypothetical protein